MSKQLLVKTAVSLCLVCILCNGASVVLAQAQLPEAAAKLYEKSSKESNWFQDAMKLKPEVRPTSDGRAFLLVWRASKAPKRWIASLHGAGVPAKGFATDDLALWHRHIKERDVGIVCLQWWLGTGDKPSNFLSPLEIYREFDRTFSELKVEPGNVMLHGFSRGSANSYAVAAIDSGKGRKLFSLCVASSGGVSLDYGPNRALLAGEYGTQPLKDTHWILVSGARDPQAARDGIEGMRRTSEWLKTQGAIVDFVIEDPREGHGALVRNPENVRQVLNRFLQANPKGNEANR